MSFNNDFAGAQIRQMLIEASDEKIRKFNSNIINTRLELLGVRAPALREIAKTAVKFDKSYFFDADPQSYEEIMVYGLALAKSGLSLDEKLALIDKLSDKMDNWAHVDCIIAEFKEFKKNTGYVLDFFHKYINSESEFKKRILVVFIMDFCLNDEFVEKAVEILQRVPQGQYYTDMGLAWAVSLGLIKYYDKFLELLKNKSFSKFVHNKAIQKAVESFRINAETKAYLKTLKI